MVRQTTSSEDKSYEALKAALDRDHAMMLARLQGLENSIQAGESARRLTELFNDLIEQARFHMQAEEAQLAEAGFSELADHRAEHVRQMAELTEAGLTLSARHDETDWRDLADFARHWVVNHIVRDDAFLGSLANAPSGNTTEVAGAEAQKAAE
ncbi:MAG: hemerythrin family protein [Magnetovibrionaceae bacterium]